MVAVPGPMIDSATWPGTSLRLRVPMPMTVVPGVGPRRTGLIAWHEIRVHVAEAPVARDNGRRTFSGRGVFAVPIEFASAEVRDRAPGRMPVGRGVTRRSI